MPHWLMAMRFVCSTMMVGGMACQDDIEAGQAKGGELCCHKNTRSRVKISILHILRFHVQINELISRTNNGGWQR